MIARKMKKVALGTMILCGGLFLDTGDYISVDQDIQQAGRIMGTGTKTTYGDCIELPGGTSYRIKTTKVTLLWIRVGKETVDEVPC